MGVTPVAMQPGLAELRLGDRPIDQGGQRPGGQVGLALIRRVLRSGRFMSPTVTPAAASTRASSAP